jgi:hypothetical protein
MMNSAFVSKSVESYVEETGFEDATFSEPSSPESSVNDDIDEEDDFHVKSSRKSRGKGVDWIDYCEGNKSGVLVEYIDLEAVQADATHMDYSKMGSSNIDVLMFKCKTKGCQYRRKYRKMGSCGTFVSYYDGVHDHTNPLIDQGDHRGLTGDQKALVQEAFQSKIKSAGNIIAFVRSKRAKLSDESEIAKFPLDPAIGKLNNYIQAYKKKNAFQYDPTPNHLKNWCDSHGPSTVNINDDSSFNTPFVLDYILVSQMFNSTSFDHVCIRNYSFITISF